jgi:flagellin
MKLATSTSRLSSGLRITTSADDAAGLAVRELMGADIASLNQGVRNANDRHFLFQTATAPSASSTKSSSA